jgi:hypothetical protein
VADTNPDELIKRVNRLVYTADRWRDCAEKVLYWASCSLKDPGASEYNDRAYNLVDRCFMIHEHKDNHSKIESDLKNIKTVFRGMANFYADVKAHGGYIRVGPPIRPGDNAYAQVGGYDNGDKTGITYVYAKCRTWDDTDLTDLTTHESVHFAGNIGHFDIGGSAAYGTAAFRLTNAQALQNASNYTWLAYLAQLPDSQWLTAT